MPAALTAAVLFGAPPLAGLLLARFLTPRRCPALRRIDLLVPAGFLVQLGAVVHAGAVRLGYVVLAVWLVARVAGAATRLERGAFLLIAAGGLLNAIAIFANGRMPYAAAETGDAGLKGVAITPETQVAWLGDVIPFLGKWISAGDLVLAIGVACLVAAIAASRAEPRDEAVPLAAR